MDPHQEIPALGGVQTVGHIIALFLRSEMNGEGAVQQEHLENHAGGRSRHRQNLLNGATKGPIQPPGLFRSSRFVDGQT
jgi:hypothetical protein